MACTGLPLAVTTDRCVPPRIYSQVTMPCTGHASQYHLSGKHLRDLSSEIASGQLAIYSNCTMIVKIHKISMNCEIKILDEKL